jgi:arabinose-5-phosphate isomerase
VKARDIMTAHQKSIRVEEYAIIALDKMKEFNITQLVALDGEKVAGFIHIHDLIKEGIV